MRRLPNYQSIVEKEKWRPGVSSVLVVSVFVAFFLQLIISNTLATRGSEINKLEKEREKLIYEMVLLKEEEASLKSLTRVENEAQKKDLHYLPDQFEYISHLEYALK